MHIAICDDNVVDRKQLERLLKRLGDSLRGQISGLYVDSYGNSNAVMDTPMDYDVYFVDYNSEGKSGLDIVISLMKAGKTGRYVLCPGIIDYEAMSTPDGVSFLRKPFSPDALASIIDEVEQSIKDKEPTMEIREDNGNSFRIHESEFLYATAKSRFITIAMTGGRSATILCTMDNFYSQLQQYPYLLLTTGKVLINAAHIVSLGAFSVTMPGNVKFPVFPLYRGYLKYIYKKLQNME